MNQTETEKLLTIIQRSYPNHFKDFDPETFEVATKLWGRSLVDYSWAEAMNAFETWINTQRFPPTLADFKELIAKQRTPEKLISPERAFEVVSDAVRKFGSYGQEKAFETFSDPIKRSVRAVGGWQKICQTELGREWDFLKKNFIEAFNEFGQEDKQQALLPEAVLNRLRIQANTAPKQLESKE